MIFLKASILKIIVYLDSFPMQIHGGHPDFSQIMFGFARYLQVLQYGWSTLHNRGFVAATARHARAPSHVHGAKYVPL